MGDRKPKIRFGANDLRLVDAPGRWRLVQVLTGDAQGLIVVLDVSLETFEAEAARLDALLGSLQFR